MTIYTCKKQLCLNCIVIASKESFLLSHMADPKNAIKSLILVVEQLCIVNIIINIYLNRQAIDCERRELPSQSYGRPKKRNKILYWS